MHIPFLILLFAGINCLFIVMPPIIQWCKYILHDKDTFLDRFSPFKLIIYSIVGGAIFIIGECILLTTLFIVSNLTSVFICILYQLLLIAILPALPKICYAIGSISLTTLKTMARIAVLCFDYLLSGIVIMIIAPYIIVYWIYKVWRDENKTPTKY